MDLDIIYNFLTNSYWAKGISKEIVRKSIDGSLCFGLFTEQNKQVGFARVVTDSATFAYLADVFILPEHRGKGLSKDLMKFIMEFPSLQNLRRFCLFTADAHKLYEKFKFVNSINASRYMEIHNPNVYN
ncbi:MAG: GNAT family N-acetyltransferase [Melioribacteraceae bacterium]|nr:GNAT family N-acetyltransferase [Melioribacteraceae bacterium]